MKIIKITFSLLVVLLPALAFSQGSKSYFDKQGKPSSVDMAYYYRTSIGGNEYKSFYINENPYFEGQIIKLDKSGDIYNTYTGTCKWFYKNGKLKQSKVYDEKGVENGLSTYYYESGKIWKEITYVNGKIKDNTFIEYDETGLGSRIFEEDFLNNINDWDIYSSNKSIASIVNGTLELTSNIAEGTSRFINIANNSSDIIVEALIDISNLKQGSKAGIIYGFKDWQNYNFFVITNSTFFVGTVFEGLSAMRAEDMYAGNILKTGYNNLKILNIDDKCVFSINGEVQLNTDSYRMYGSKVGVVVSGINKIVIDKLITKEVDFTGSNNNVTTSSEDKNVKGTGSGLFVSKNGYIITNYHVIDEAKNIVVETKYDGIIKSYNAVVVKSDKDNDISILKIDDKNFTNLSKVQYAFKETGAIDVGSSVYTIGFPLALTGMGKEAKFTDGKISAKTGYNNAINSFQTTVPVQPGNSGGPLFDDKGKLIGLVNAKIHEADNVSYAIKLNYVKNLIEVLPETIDLPNDTSIASLPLQEQVKVLSNYVVLIKIK
jgi:S1-C subfamily serine protease